MILKNLDKLISNNVVEIKANELLCKHSLSCKWVTSLPIPVMSIVENTLDLTVVYDDLSQYGQKVLGALLPWEKTILLNESFFGSSDQAPSGMENFTIAHEIGHWILHVNHSCLEQIPLFDLNKEQIICRDGDKDVKEHTANRFAARILMPKQMLMEALVAVDISQRSEYRQFADYIGVSREALHYRLSDLGIVHSWD